MVGGAVVRHEVPRRLRLHQRRTSVVVSLLLLTWKLRLVGGTTVAMGTTPVAIASAGMQVVVMAVLGEGGPTGLLHTRRKQPRHMPTRGTCAYTCA